MIPDALLSELRIADVVTFVTVHRCGTISAAARELRVTPSQVSKSIGRLEDLLGKSLLSRSARGVSLLDEGRRVLSQFEEMLAVVRQLGRGDVAAERVLSIAAPSYLGSYFLPALVADRPGFRVRALEFLPPGLIRAHIASGTFDVALTLGSLPLPPSWEARCLGHTERAMFGSPRTAERLGPPPIPMSRLSEVPMISPIYLADTGFVPVEDDCPLSRRERTIGNETTTLGLGLAFAAITEQIVFGPLVGAVPYLDAGTLVKLEIEGWDERDELYLAYDTARITTSERRTLESSIQAALARLDAY